jgi:predicted O-methyltransferase YrrM
MKDFVPKSQPQHKDITRTGDYSSILYELAEKVKAKSIIETGLGAGVSGMAFVESLANRSPASLVTVELDPSSPLSPERHRNALERGVTWDVIYGNAMTVNMTRRCDLLYIDLSCSEEGLVRTWKNLGPLLKSGGLCVVDGIGPRLIGQGYPGTEEACRTIATDCKSPCEIVWYRDDIAFGVMEKK